MENKGRLSEKYNKPKKPREPIDINYIKTELEAIQTLIKHNLNKNANIRITKLRFYLEER